MAVVLLAVAGAAGPAVATVAENDTESGPGGRLHYPGLASETDRTATSAIGLVQELRLLPDRPGEIGVRLTYTVPTGVGALRARLPPKATVTGTRGFVRLDATEFGWDRTTVQPELTYRLAVNETINATGPIAGRGDFAFVDTGAWALVEIPPAPTSWTRTADGPVEVSRRVTVAGEGAVGDAIAFLGAHREVRRTAHGQTFRLIVPSSAELATTEGEILDSVTAASDWLQVGDRDPEVFMVAAPTGPLRWGVRGLQLGESSLWVRDSERLDTADNVWLHEYVHTRQAYSAGAGVRWFTEASASYYAALLSLEQSRIGFDAFRERLAIGAGRQTANAVLADPGTWNDVAPYLKGVLVAGEVDRQLRLATNRSGTLQDVFYRLNRHPGTVSGAAFEAMVRAVGGAEVADLANRYTSTGAGPTMWGRAEHVRAFPALPPRISYRAAGPNGSVGYRLSGPYRSGTFSAAHQHLVVGETLEFDVTVGNSGGTAGEYDVDFLVDGTVQGRATGRLGPGETTEVAFAHRFTATGEHEVTVGGSRLEVSVHEPAVPAVESLRVVPSRAEPDTEVQAIATVRNDQPYPANATLTLTVNGVAVATRRVTLGPSASSTVNFGHALATAGVHVFRLGDRTANVTIELASTPIPTPDPPTEPASGEADGFGVAVTVVALVGFLLARRHRS